MKDTSSPSEQPPREGEVRATYRYIRTGRTPSLSPTTYLAAPSHILAVAQFKASIVTCNAKTALQIHLAFRSPGVTLRPYMLWSFPGTWTLRNSILCFSISCLPALSVFARSEILFLDIAAVVTATVVAPSIGIYSSHEQGVPTP